MIVDAHVHYMDAPSAAQPLAKPHSALEIIPVDELVRLAHEIGVDRVVQVTPSTLGYDNRSGLAGVAARPDVVAGVIGRFDPLAPDVDARLEAYAAQPGMMGVRLTLFDPGAERWLTDRALDPFLRAAERTGIIVQLFAPFQAHEMQATVRRFPGAHFLIDHLGLRTVTGADNSRPFRQWNELIELAAEPNAWIKVSYFPEAVLESESYPFPAAQRRFRELYEAAGAGSLVWGSNFPPVRRACSYRQALDFIRVECTFLSASDRAAILGDNIMSLFRQTSAGALQ